MKSQLLLNEVARSLSLPAHVISYAISSGKIREPELRINNHRVFSKADVDQIKKYFAGKKAAKKEDNE